LCNSFEVVIISVNLLYRGIDLTSWRELMKEKPEKTDLDRFAQHLLDNHFFPNKVVVDCTAHTEVANRYYEWLKQGIHVITPNKKANSGPLDRVCNYNFCHGSMF
jgi:bifunctional aspartokinase / homoserine dehydrogenase 1